MERKTYNRFRKVVLETSGINLGPSKQALVAARIGKRMRALGLTSYRDYLDLVASDATSAEMTQLVDAICTNVTSFFREQDHFAFVRQVVSDERAAGRNKFRIWSAACSTGEEVYSLAMTLHDLTAGGCDIRILGTDLSTKALTVALRAEYPAAKLADVDPQIRKRFFHRTGKGQDAVFAVRPELRSMTVFRQLNLSKPPFPLKGPLDIVLCRNVMIYFHASVRESLLAEIHRLMRAGGYLSLGHAETLGANARGFKPLEPSIYVRC